MMRAVPDAPPRGNDNKKENDRQRSRSSDSDKRHRVKFAVLVNEGPYTHQASDTAYHFTKAALEKGHEVVRVFFYHDGVLNATALATPPKDDRNVTERWSALAQQYKLDMVACIAAAQRRGILDDDQARRRGLDDDNLAPWFRISGLGQLMDAMIAADRVMVFGD
jgi:tRNA 2-thiouridine synthesizing protein D